MFCLEGIGVIRMKQYEAKCHEAKEKQKIWPTLLRMTWDIQVDRWSGPSPTPIQKRKKTNKVKSQNLIKPRQHSYSIVKVLNSASEMKILQYVTDLWTMNITFYKEKLNPLSSLMTGATYWCKKQTAIVLVSDRQRNAASQKLIWLMILARYFIHVWIGVSYGAKNKYSSNTFPIYVSCKSYKRANCIQLCQVVRRKIWIDL